MTEEPQPKPSLEANQEKLLLDDEKIVEEIKLLYSTIHSQIKERKESEEVKEIHDLLNEISTNLRKYEKDKTDKSYLDGALAAARLAKVKLNTITTPQGLREQISSLMIGGLFGLAIFWGILRLLFGWLFAPGVFYLDAFVIAFVGAIASAIIYLGRSAMIRIDSIKTFCNLAASPFVAVILVILFSELAIGVGGAVSSSGADSDIMSFTLQGASTELKYAFAFMFGFFGEISVEMLRNILSSTTRKE